MEHLSFNSNGQWTLSKTAGVDESIAEKPNYSNEHASSYRGMHQEGELPEDHGQKGTLHNGPASRAPKKTGKQKMEGQVSTPVSSRFADWHPGQMPTT